MQIIIHKLVALKNANDYYYYYEAKISTDKNKARYKTRTRTRQVIRSKNKHRQKQDKEKIKAGWKGKELLLLSQTKHKIWTREKKQDKNKAIIITSYCYHIQQQNQITIIFFIMDSYHYTRQDARQGHKQGRLKRGRIQTKKRQEQDKIQDKD